MKKIENRWQRLIPRPQVALGGSIIIAVGLVLYFAIMSPDYEAVFSTLGITMVSTGFVAIIYDTILYRSMSEELRGELRQTISELHSVTESGIRDVIEGTEIFSELYKSQGELTGPIDILQTWTPNLVHILTRCGESILAGEEVRILLVEPFSISSTRRTDDLLRQQNVCERVQRAPAEIRRAKEVLLRGKEGNFNVRLRHYQSSPAFAYYRHGNLAWIGLYWFGHQADDGPTIAIDTNTPSALTQFLTDHFEDVWGKSKSIDWENTTGGYRQELEERNKATILTRTIAEIIGKGEETDELIRIAEKHIDDKTERAMVGLLPRDEDAAREQP